MATDKGVIQGYTGVAAVDDKHQIIVAAEAHGTGAEQALLLPLIALDDQQIPALIVDNHMRQRDERFADQGKHTAKPDPLYDKSGKPKQPPRYKPADFD